MMLSEREELRMKNQKLGYKNLEIMEVKEALSKNFKERLSRGETFRWEPWLSLPKFHIKFSLAPCPGHTLHNILGWITWPGTRLGGGNKRWILSTCSKPSGSPNTLGVFVGSQGGLAAPSETSRDFVSDESSSKGREEALGPRWVSDIMSLFVGNLHKLISIHKIHGFTPCVV